MGFVKLPGLIKPHGRLGLGTLADFDFECWLWFSGTAHNNSTSARRNVETDRAETNGAVQKRGISAGCTEKRKSRGNSVLRRRGSLRVEANAGWPDDVRS